MSTGTAGVGSAHFRHPPLNEVVFSVQFENEVIDEVGALSEFRLAVAQDFPDIEKYQAVLPASETFDVMPAPPTLQIQQLTGAIPQRYWFVSPNKTLVVQVQPDRLLFNWRQVEGTEEYPRYDTLAPRFLELLNKFLDCKSVDREAAKVGWVELQYINPIEVPGDSATHGQLARILNFLIPDPTREVLPPVEDTQLQQRYRISGPDGSPRGRLYLSAVPGIRQLDQKRAYVVTLLARGRPEESDDLEKGVLGFLDTAHHLIVNGFREVTTDEMHKLWEEL